MGGGGGGGGVRRACQLLLNKALHGLTLSTCWPFLLLPKSWPRQLRCEPHEAGTWSWMLILQTLGRWMGPPGSPLESRGGSHPPSTSKRQERWVCLDLPGSSPFQSLAEDQAPGPRTEGPLSCPSPYAGSWALFSFHPVLLGFNGQKLCPSPPTPLPHCSDTNVYSPQGLLRVSIREGRCKDGLQRADCVLGPWECTGPGRGELEPTWATLGSHETKGQGQSRPCSQGPTVAQEGERDCSCLFGGPLPVSKPDGKSGIQDESELQSSPMWPRNPVCHELRELPALLGAVGRQPWLTFEGRELFWQVLFIAVLLVTEELLQRRDHTTKTGLGAKVTYKQPLAGFTPANPQGPFPQTA